MSTPLNVCRQFLRIMSDETFLSSVSYIDFENRYISVKTGYWRYIASYLKNNYSIRNVNSVLRTIKTLFLERITSVSATKLKDFFLGKIFNSFINFKNLLPYAKVLLYGRKKFDYEKLRRERYFERKAKNHYLWCMGYEAGETNTSEFNVIENELPNLPNHEDISQPMIVDPSELPRTSEFAQDHLEPYQDEDYNYDDLAFIDNEDYQNDDEYSAQENESDSEILKRLHPEVTNDHWANIFTDSTDNGMGYSWRRDPNLVNFNNIARRHHEVYGPDRDTIDVNQPIEYDYIPINENVLVQEYGGNDSPSIMESDDFRGYYSS